jgi:2-polyprenyl-3-methyl-5-hydroxy-6-metoxy-1,4-benzoquinol methylase
MNKEIKIKKGKYEVRLDEQEGYCHLFPLPSENELKNFYKREFYKKSYDGQKNDSAREVREEEEKLFRDMRFEDILETVETEIKEKKIIDVGCGYGNFLSFCHSRGYSVMGIEPGQQAVDYIRRRYNFNVVQTGIEDIGANVSEKFPAAALLDVLEHLREPAKALIGIRDNILADQGVLVVRTPNEFNNLQLVADEEYQLNHWWVSCPDHINYFTVGHLEKLIENCGFEVFLKESSFPLEMFLLFGDQYVGNIQLGREVHNKRVRFEKTLRKHDNDFKRKLFRSFAGLGIGREITIYARKKKIK